MQKIHRKGDGGAEKVKIYKKRKEKRSPGRRKTAGVSHLFVCEIKKKRLEKEPDEGDLGEEITQIKANVRIGTYLGVQGKKNQRSFCRNQGGGQKGSGKKNQPYQGELEAQTSHAGASLGKKKRGKNPVGL